MKQYHTSIEIHASVQKVWTILTDFSDYPNWNPLVSALTGDIKEGGVIKTTIVPLNNTFSAKLLSFKENKEIVWQGKMLATFILAGKHYYRLIQKEKQLTVLEHGEYFTGLFSSFISRKLLIKMEEAFVAHNEALKKRVENGK